MEAMKAWEKMGMIDSYVRGKLISQFSLDPCIQMHENHFAGRSGPHSYPVRFERCTFNGNIDLRGKQLYNITFLDCVFMGDVDFRGAKLSSANFRGTQFVNKVRFNDADLRNTLMHQIKANYINFDGAKIDCTDLDQAEIEAVYFGFADLNYTRLTGTNLGGVNFSSVLFNSVLVDKSTRGIYFSEFPGNIFPRFDFSGMQFPDDIHLELMRRVADANPRKKDIIRWVEAEFDIHACPFKKIPLLWQVSLNRALAREYLSRFKTMDEKIASLRPQIPYSDLVIQICNHMGWEVRL